VYIEPCWEKAAPSHEGGREVLLKKRGDQIANEVKPTMTWYEATRHSFVSRNLAGGASLDEVSAAVGHSSPVVTKRFYDHFVRWMTNTSSCLVSHSRRISSASPVSSSAAL
jgi:hypothetical protein